MRINQHYSFAVNAFVDLVKKYGQEEYDFSLRETQTYKLIEDVAQMRSEIGILFLNDFNEKSDYENIEILRFGISSVICGRTPCFHQQASSAGKEENHNQ